MKSFFLSTLTVLFVGLKLTDVIAWSWWLVLAPLWVPYTIALLLLIGALTITVNSIKR